MSAQPVFLVPQVARPVPHASRGPARRRALRERAVAAAADQDGVLSRAQLADLDYDRDDIRREANACRWRVLGRQTVATHKGPLGFTATCWSSLWETGIHCTTLDGVTALLAAGLTGWTQEQLHVSVPRGARCPSSPGVRVHRVRRLPDEAATTGIPRVRPEYAAVRAAHWAVSDRQAATILAMVVQQRLTTVERLRVADEAIGGRTRRAFIRQVIADIADGAQSLGELDFARMCRRHAVSEPLRQVVRTTPTGRVYLDVRWSTGLVVEIDGSGHRQGLAVTDDNLRQNEVTLGTDTVLRFDLLALRLAEVTVMDQVKRALRLTS